MMSAVSGRVVFVRKFAKVVGTPRVGGGRFVRNLSSFCQEFKPYRGAMDATSNMTIVPTQDRPALDPTARCRTLKIPCRRELLRDRERLLPQRLTPIRRTLRT